VPGERVALIIANDEYDDSELARLEAPGHDAAALAEVLGDADIGNFEVRILRNETVQAGRIAIEEFFLSGTIDDLLLLYFSCHGLKSPEGELFLAMRDTRPGLLAATGLAADFVNRRSAESRAGRIAMFFDCCFGGAFEKGMIVRAAGDAVAKDTFSEQETHDHARGRVVVTASTATQYAFEAGVLAEHDERTSVFTTAVVEGLSTGEADRDGDGRIGVGELFTYVEQQVQRRRPQQRPQKFLYGASGEIELAKTTIHRKPLEPWVVEMLSSAAPEARRDAVAALRERLKSTDLGLALSAWDAVESLCHDEDRDVARAARNAEAEATLRVRPDSLELTVAGEQSVTTQLILSGPPIALATSTRGDEWWLSAEYHKPHVRVTVTDPETDEAAGTLVLESHISVSHVPVRVRRVEGPPPHPPAPPVPSLFRRALARAKTSWRWIAIGVTVLLLGALAVGRPWDDDSSASNGVSLPQGPRLDDNVVVWVDHGNAIWRLVRAGPRGTPTPLADSPARTQEFPVVTPDRRTVLYLSFPPEDPTSTTDTMLHVVATDGSGDRELPLGKTCPNPGRPALSPDASRLAVVCFAEDGARMGGIRIITLSGQLDTVLDPHADAGNPTWSQDGQYIVYWVQNDGPMVRGEPSTDLRAIAVDQSTPSDPVQLTQNEGRVTVPALSPMNDEIVFVRATNSRPPDLYLINLYRTESGLRHKPERRLPVSASASVEEKDPVWSLDGSEILYRVDGKFMKVEPREDATPEPFFHTEVRTDGFMMAWARR
jgi:hypothetical protein